MDTRHLSILTLVSILCLCSSSSSQTTSKLSISQHIAVPSQELEAETNLHRWLRTINNLASSSLARAYRLKTLKDNSISQIPLFPQRSAGEYLVSLSFGTPSQKPSFIMDTGSSLVWFPCTHRYKCYHCSYPSVSPTKIHVFMPQLSSSAKYLGCNNEKCGWVRRTIDTIQCNAKQNCSYEQDYGVGSTSGSLLSETLNFPEGDVTDFAVGCSVSSTSTVLGEGIVGFGRGLESLPDQMGLKKFSYCMVSHRFDDTPVSSELVLVRDSSNSVAGDGSISYTKFPKNPPNFNEYYYLNLQYITVGGEQVMIPYVFSVPGSNGNGGTIIDSGTTLTIMDEPVYSLVIKAFEMQTSRYHRAAGVDTQSGLSHCFNFRGNPPEFPAITFHFEGGANLSLPMADYFASQEPGVSCLPIMSNVPNSGSGPYIIIGNYQQQNVYVEYDLENGRLGLKKTICN